MIFNFDYDTNVRILEQKILTAINESTVHVELVELLVKRIHDDLVKNIQTNYDRGLIAKEEAEQEAREKAEHEKAEQETKAKEEIDGTGT